MLLFRWALVIIAGIACGLVYRYCYRLDRTRARELARYRAAVLAIARTELPEPPSSHATGAQWMRSVARDALEPNRHNAPDPRVPLERTISAAMLGNKEPPLNIAVTRAGPWYRDDGFGLCLDCGRKPELHQGIALACPKSA